MRCKEQFMTRAVRRLFVAGFLVFAVSALAAPATFAQSGAAASLSGTVTDTSGGIVPGANVIVKRMDTGLASEAVTNGEGQFTVPALSAGKYSVMVSLAGFKTVTINDVEVRAGLAAGVAVKMEVGGVQEQVVVSGGSEIVATQSSTVSQTLTSQQIGSLPLTSRSGLDFVVNLPGVNTPGGSRNSTVNGLPQGAINITLDGMSIQDNYLKTTDGFFARVSPRLDSIEEVTVTSAANGADSGGQGAVNIKFVTKSGTNSFKGNIFHTLRHDGLNANTFFNNRNLPADPKTGAAPKAALRQYQPGVNAGGPISIPGLFDGHDKAFFFFNYEDSRSPSKITRNRTILNQAAMNGVYAYGTTSVNLLTLAANNGQVATIDPIIGKLFADMVKASGSGSITPLSDPLLSQASFQVPTNNFTPYPLGRVDYNVSKNHRLSGSFTYNHINSTPDTLNNRDPFFPGFPNTGSQQSTRYLVSQYFRSTFGANLVNTFHFGATGGATYFSPELSPALFGGNAFGDQGGYYLNFTGCCATAIANAGNTGNFSAREASTRVIEDDLNWLKGKHNLSLGLSITQGRLWLRNQRMVPEVRFGLVSGDPAAGMFTTANFPGASTTQLNNARALYAILTGRVSQILGNARLSESTNEYQYLGNGFQRGHMWQSGFYVQDNWRVRNNLTVNAGLRYELQDPFVAENNSYSTATLADVCGISGIGADGQCNLFTPGTLTGRQPFYVNYTMGTPAFKTDRNNFAPSLGLTWRPSFDSGMLRTLMGQDGDTVFFASYAMSYERAGMSDFSGVFSDNPGVEISVNRNATLGNLNNDGLGFPVLLRDRSRLGPPAFSVSQTYPLFPVLTDTVHIFNPDLQVPYAQTWAGGLRRKMTKDVGVEVRYVGTRHLQGWATFDINEADITGNGFAQEFRRAQANLQANIAAGRGNTFAFTGAPGTSPLPIYLAYFTGTPIAQAGDSSKYTGTLWTSTDFTNPLAVFNPQPFTPAGTNASTGLDGDSTRRANAARAGLPVNFFRANPDIGDAQIEGNSGYTKYDGLQMEVTKRMSHGLLLQGSYVFGNSYTSSRYSLKAPRKQTLQTGAEGGVTHALKANWVYQLPFGSGRRFLGSANGLVDRLVGGWELDGILRLQSGQLLDFGNVRLVGMSRRDLQKAVKLGEFATKGINASAPVNIYLLPQDILENTVRAFSVSATSPTGYGNLGAPTGRYLAPASGPDCMETIANGYGDCGVRTLVVTGPTYQRWDISAVKRTRLAGRTMFEFRADLINAFNHPNFTPVIQTTANATNADNYRVTGVQENSSRIIQLVTRFSW
jgi:carboxypeptidase family protein/TonB-dependent receptor-like protein